MTLAALIRKREPRPAGTATPRTDGQEPSAVARIAAVAVATPSSEIPATAPSGLSHLIRENRFAARATAIPANAAIDGEQSTRTVANVATIAVASPSDETSRRWRVRLPGRGPVDVICSSDATMADVAVLYRGATVDSVPTPPKHRPTEDEAEELRELLQDVGEYNGWPGSEIAEATTVGLTEIGAALECWRSIADAFIAETTSPAISAKDDRRRCTDCGNLYHYPGTDGFRRCAAAKRGELPCTSRDYSPVLDVPRRCEGYAPLSGDPDRRPGRERWPGLIPKAQPDGRGTQTDH